ncbi:hypothetical protein Rhopal_004972-T1 [Rhodotorula paludigena]|uniref:Pseudouridine synthase RsuA/RluA-like domain-containing protein n=1 Tax=Rhodotorula paludigena TaxID=86838 RepID=A0AAV5GN88_9BASI|nr:hypothetical protein Rhopal_004972-T1 [Rhodotorula paludigena]
MTNSTATASSRAQSGQAGKGEKGTSRKTIPPPTGAFALPPARPEYFEEDGLRKVKPYMYVRTAASDGTASTVNSGAWIRDRTNEYYEWAIETGIIVVNNRKSSPDYMLRNGDLISNVLHRHEPPVVAGPIKIIYDGRLPGNDGETLVVEKPGSMPVHPTGRYNFNTLLEILKYDYDLPLVHTSNRLDRLTSGVMDSKTIFTRMSYDERSNTSVVHCRPITGRSHQIRVHLQFMGHPIANDPIYQNRAAWGDDGGKGGVFGSERGGTTADREERRRRGEQFMALEQAKIVEPAHAGDSAAPPMSEPASAEPSAVEQQLDRKLHDPTLTDGARRAILALREVKDEADGWARHRDLEGIERARQSGPSKLSVDATAAALAEAQIDGKSSAESADATINDGGFCSTCFTPLMPDPRPEQLFIWLHAMRYQTTEWDWSSELPYWAEAEYEVPLTSILS